jgi:hypothetical protein
MIAALHPWWHWVVAIPVALVALVAGVVLVAALTVGRWW